MRPAPSRQPGAGISRGMWIALAVTLALTAASYGIRYWREAARAAAIEEASVAAETSTTTAVSTTTTSPTTTTTTETVSTTTLAPPPAPSAPPPPQALSTEAANEPITIINPANGLPMTLPPGTPLPPGVTPIAKAAKPASVVVPTPQALPPAASVGKIQMPATTPPPPPAPTPVSPAPPGLRASVPGPTGDAMASRRAAAAPPPGIASAPPPPPPPVAEFPAPSFQLIGRYNDGSRPYVFLAHGDKVIAAKAGDTLPDGFKLKAIRPGGIVILRLANKEKIEMMLGTP